ncbi:hypothetical protein, partial [Marinimicrobium koreense]|uniref:hypothetical protein n=1 Tax=Marinimicrobium koreense TaxID=306545 RepID=UPI003F708AEF
VGFPHVRVGHRQALKLKYPESAMVRGIFFCSPQKLEALADALTVMVMGAVPGAHPFGAT